MKTFTIIKTIRYTETLIIEADDQDEAVCIAENRDGEDNNDHTMVSIDVIKTSSVQADLKMTSEGNVIDSNGVVYLAKVGARGSCDGCAFINRNECGSDITCIPPFRTNYELKCDVIFIKQV